MCEALPTATAVHKHPVKSTRVVTARRAHSARFQLEPRKKWHRSREIFSGLRAAICTSGTIPAGHVTEFSWLVGVASVCPLRDHSRLVDLAWFTRHGPGVGWLTFVDNLYGMLRCAVGGGWCSRFLCFLGEGSASFPRVLLSLFLRAGVQRRGRRGARAVDGCG